MRQSKEERYLELEIRQTRRKKFDDFVKYKGHIINLNLPTNKPCPVCGAIIDEEKGVIGKEKFRLRKQRNAIDKNGEIWTCAICVQRMIEAPANLRKKPKSDKPRGWKLMKEYVHKDGTVYFKGEEQSKLKGKRPITKIEKKTPKPKLSRHEKESQRLVVLTEINRLKKLLKKDIKKMKRKSLEIEFRKQNRILKKLK